MRRNRFLRPSWNVAPDDCRWVCGDREKGNETVSVLLAGGGNMGGIEAKDANPEEYPRPFQMKESSVQWKATS